MANRCVCVAVKMLKWFAQGVWTFTKWATLVVGVLWGLGWLVSDPSRQAVFELVCTIIGGAFLLVLIVGTALAIIEEGREKLQEFKDKCARER